MLRNISIIRDKRMHIQHDIPPPQPGTLRVGDRPYNAFDVVVDLSFGMLHDLFDLGIGQCIP